MNNEIDLANLDNTPNHIGNKFAPNNQIGKLTAGISRPNSQGKKKSFNVKKTINDLLNSFTTEEIEANIKKMSPSEQVYVYTKLMEINKDIKEKEAKSKLEKKKLSGDIAKDNRIVVSLPNRPDTNQ